MEPQPATRVVLVRHGESMATVERRLGGPRTCQGLSELGRRQVQQLRRRLEETGEIRADALYASAYPRAIETAQILAPAFGDQEVRVEAGFGEHDPGPECDGLTFADFVERHGTPDWESDPHAVTFPGGETVAEFQRRVGTALNAVTSAHAGQTAVICCHGGVVDAVLRLAMRTAPTGVFEMYTTNTAITELLLVRPGRWRLLRYNDAAHLAGLRGAGDA